MKNLVSTRWLNENLKNSNLVIVDCRFDLCKIEYGPQSYNKGHIKNAFFMDMNKDLASHVKEHGGRHPLPEQTLIKDKFCKMGIEKESIVVAYDDGELAGACRLWWILKYFGHENVFVLDGGIQKWIKDGYELTNEDTYKDECLFEINLDENMCVDMEYVKSKIKNEKTLIIDSRSNERYKGECEPVDKIAGHIPSAKNYFWMDVLENNEIKDRDSLDKHFRQCKKFDEIIVYCGSGITASVNFLALCELGYNVKLYSGSWSDWITYKDNVVAIG